MASNVVEKPVRAREWTTESIPAPRAVPKPTKLPKESFSWRVIRLAIAIPLAIVSLAALFPFSVLPVSTQAVVNARLSRVRAPIEGQLGTVQLETGDVVTTGERLTTISAPNTLLRSEQIGAMRSKGDLIQESSRVGAQLVASEMEKARYDQMYSQYLAHLADDMQSQIGELQLEIADADKRAQSANEEVQRDQQALTDHLIPRSMLDQATQKADAAQQKVNEMKAHQRRLQKQIAEAKGGFISDPALAPSFMGARNQAMADVDRLTAEKAALDKSIDGAGDMVMNPGQSTTLGAPLTVVSPVSGTIWSRAVATGQEVQDGDDMFRIADANSIHVEVWLDRRYGPQLSIGDIALVYMSGMGTELQGRVTSFEGTSRRIDDQETDAIDLQPVHPDQYHVNIELPPSDRKAVYIGQAAKVLFPGSKHPFRSKIYFWLTRL